MKTTQMEWAVSICLELWVTSRSICDPGCQLAGELFIAWVTQISGLQHPSSDSSSVFLCLVLHIVSSAWPSPLWLSIMLHILWSWALRKACSLSQHCILLVIQQPQIKVTALGYAWYFTFHTSFQQAVEEWVIICVDWYWSGDICQCHIQNQDWEFWAFSHFLEEYLSG